MRRRGVNLLFAALLLSALTALGILFAVALRDGGEGSAAGTLERNADAAERGSQGPSIEREWQRILPEEVAAAGSEVRSDGIEADPAAGEVQLDSPDETPFGTVRGTVETYRGRRLGHHHVAVLRNGASVRSAYADASGEFVLERVSVGEGTMGFRFRNDAWLDTGIPVTVFANGVTTVTVLIEGTARIHGVVLGPPYLDEDPSRRTPLRIRLRYAYETAEHAMVDVSVSTDGPVELADGTVRRKGLDPEAAAKEALEDPPGHFEIVGLRPERYVLSFEPDIRLLTPQLRVVPIERTVDVREELHLGTVVFDSIEQFLEAVPEADSASGDRLDGG